VVDSRTIPVVRIDAPEGKALLRRITDARTSRRASVDRIVARVLADVARDGDRALFDYTRKFEKRSVSARTVRLTAAHIASQARKTPPDLQAAVRGAAERIRVFHARQKPQRFALRTAEGILSQRIVALERVGVYVPGGHTTYPSSVLMNVIPARVAGVAEIAAVTPLKGLLDPPVAFALQLLGVDEVYQVGGCQAVAALAYGTGSIRPVDKIVGPGNAYVAAAKRMVYGTVDIDSVAGPSEVAVVADTSANPGWVALDMLAQAEHGSGDEIAVCVCESVALARRVATSLSEEIDRSPARAVLRRLPGHALALFVSKTRSQSIAFVNRLAPEHLQIMTRSPRRDASAVRNAGAVFVGSFTPVALGDYYVGTNHVLPTGGTARFASGLGVDDFVKRVSVVDVSRRGLRLAARPVSRLARAENFIHHAMSVERRIAAGPVDGAEA
jgi:histidinol dehydrogenase